MRPIFTVHAGEYLVGDFIESNLKDLNDDKLNVWVPSKDTGVDLLISDSSNKKTTSIQVKFSKDYNVANGTPESHKRTINGWWNLDKDKIRNSPADYWVFVLHTFEKNLMHYIIISPGTLHAKLERTQSQYKKFNAYFCVTSDGECWETRGLKSAERNDLLMGKSEISPDRNYSQFLNTWDVLFTDW